MLTRTLSSLLPSSKALQTTARKIASVLTMLAMVFGSFAPVLAFPSSTFAQDTDKPDLIVTKTNDLQGGSAVVGVPFHWILAITNKNTEPAKFKKGEIFLKDELPQTGATYGTPTVNAGGDGDTVACSINAGTLLCKVSTVDENNHLTIPHTKTVTVSIPVTPTGSGSLVNPRVEGVCKVDPLDTIKESDEGNNNCSNTVSVISNTAVLTVTKIVSGGAKHVSDFPLSLNGLAITSGTATTTAPGTYTVAEISDPTYTGVFGGDCHGDGQVVLAAGDHKACTLTNTFHPTQIVVHKVITNTGGGTGTFSSFSYTVNGGSPVNFDASGSATTTAVTGPYTVIEDNNASYTPAYSAGCTGTIAVGETKDCTITNTYVIPKAPSCDAQLSTMTVVSDTSTLVGTTSAAHAWIHTAWLPEADGAEWIWSTTVVTNPSATTTVDFTKTFSVAGTPTGGSIQIVADNSYAVLLNGNPVPGCSVDPYSPHYAAFETCVIPANLFVPGLNTLSIHAVNAAYPTEDPHTNPAGIMYKLTVNKNACIPQSDVTICKYSDANRTPLPGWTMTLKGDGVEDVVVPTNTSAGTSSVNVLTSGISYIATAVGTWLNQNGKNPVDAEYSTIDNWATHMDGYTGYQTDILELQINQAFDPNSNWGTYNAAHTYAQAFTGAGAPAHFRIFDGGSIGATSTTPNEAWYGDNSGTLAVNISKGYAGITAANGCVTFSAVPVGSYTVGEIMQDGWSNISGLGQVVVSHATEAFNVVNHLTSATAQCNPNATSTIVSDVTTQESGHDSVLVSFINASWTAIIYGASWIWGEDPVADPANPSTETFTKTFTVAGTPLGATLDLAADNTYTVTVNGNAVCSSNAENNFSATTTCAVPASSLITGTNTMVFTLTNLKLPADWQGPVNGQTNPAGLLYKLTINNNECKTPDSSFVKVHIYKYLRTSNGDGVVDTQVQDNAGLAAFPMKATWNAIIGSSPSSGTDVDYVLGNNWGGTAFKYAADTAPMQAPVAHYATYENTDNTNVLPIGAGCAADKFRLLGYKSGPTLEAAQGASLQTVAPDFTSFNSDKYVIVVNEDCNQKPVIKVHIFKYLSNGDGGEAQIPNDSSAPSFPMIATYAIAGVATNLNPGDKYVLGDFGGVGGSDGGLKYAANTIKLSAGDEYGTHEVAGGDSVVVVNAGQCSAGKYYLLGYKTGSSLAAAEIAPISTTSPDFLNITSDKYVIVINAKCATIPIGPQGATLTIVKHTVGGDGTFVFALSGNEATVPLSTVGGWATSTAITISTASTTISEQQASGWDFSAASCVYENNDVGITLAAGVKEVKADTGDHVTCTFTNTRHPVPAPTFTSSTTTVRAGDLANSFSDVFASSTKWFFYNDNNDTINSSLGSFVTGPSTAPLGSGSAEIVDGAAGVGDRTDMATYRFSSTTLASITSLKFSAYSHSGIAGANESPYLVFNVSLTGADTWQKRLVYVPGANGSVPQDAWNTYDTINGGAGLWTWSGYAANGNKWPDNNTSQYRSWSAIKAAFPNASVRKTDSFMGVRVGEPGPSNYKGDIDNFVIGVLTGLNTDTKTFDFEPTPVVIENTPSTGGQGGTHGGGGNGPVGFFALSAPTLPTPTGVVKGASTSTIEYGAECERYITDFIKPGARNDPTQVARVQYVLAILEGLSVPQNGIYDSATIAGVKAFQTKYASDILAPWGMRQSTGFVYLTTRKKLNEIYCKNGQAFPLTPAEQAIIDVYRKDHVLTGVAKPHASAVMNPKDSTTSPEDTTGDGDSSTQVGAAAAAVGSTTTSLWGKVKSWFHF